MRPSVLLTRPLHQSESFAADLRQALPGVSVVISPAIEIRSRDVDVPDRATLILTSANAIASLPPLPPLPGRLAFCVGPSTASAAKRLGLRVEVADGDAASLIRLILARNPSGPLLHVRGEHRAADVAGALRASGLRAEEVVGYAQHALAPTAEASSLLAGAAPVLIPLFSPRSAALVGRWAKGSNAPLHLAALSPAVAKNWGGALPVRQEIAETPDSDAMLHALNKLLIALHHA